MIQYQANKSCDNFKAMKNLIEQFYLMRDMKQQTKEPIFYYDELNINVIKKYRNFLS